MSISAQYASTPNCGVGQVSVANASRDGTGTINTVFTAGASGSRIDTVTVKSTGTVTDGMVRLYIHDGVNARLYTEVPIVATIPSASVAAFETGIKLDLVIPTGYSLRASTEKAETFNVIAVGGDF